MSGLGLCSSSGQMSRCKPWFFAKEYTWQELERVSHHDKAYTKMLAKLVEIKRFHNATKV